MILNPCWGFNHKTIINLAKDIDVEFAEQSIVL